ncbi:hypothetical protein [Candidatus Methanomassiliicoccus intestinalis]|uniref:hypothetical protein n=1 Tax=Candidatus Methanomassiliicoccus intestinalis TaxID=1406512 RepID=UPI0037DD8C17
MVSVTQRIKQIKQPRGGYINPKQFRVCNLNDSKTLYESENINVGLVGSAVDYMTRFIAGTSAEDAFKISLRGSFLINEHDNAKKLLDQIKGLDDISITNACKLAGYDVCFRASIAAYRPVEEIQPDSQTIENIRIMIQRGIEFFNQYGPISKDGFTFEGGYTKLVQTGDGDFLTEDTLWDFKVSNKEPTNAHTLQLLMYYIMGTHSIHEEFQNIKRLGIFNPRLNNVYLLDISSIPSEVIEQVSEEVIGY